MPDTLLRTKLFIPPLRPDLVSRPRLLAHLNQGLQPGRKLILVSAPAGFGKTTLVGEWVQQQEEGRGKREEDGGTQPSIFTLQPYRVAWLSLEEGDKEPVRFLAYLVAALQTVETTLGEQVLVALRSPQPPPVEQLLAALVNEISALREKVVLVLDDYHLPDARPVDEVLTYLLAHLPPQMHLVIVTREDPNLPLARLRARGQLTEVRVADLRFTPAEAAEFLNRAMDLALSAEQIAALEARTEGWIAGLQLAALSLRERQGTDAFIESFTGSHHFVLDYLLEEVLQQQPAAVQAFLLRTSILDRLCGPLCDAVMGKEEGRRER
jgi:LuxR family maltose regulon positive regulatory protein